MTAPTLCVQKIILLVLSFTLSIQGIAQSTHDGLEFSKTEFSFPKTENWISTIDSIEVKNISSKKIFLLKQKYPREFQVRFPAKAIEPGETQILEVVYKPTGSGKFKQSFEIYQSASATPISITYKGEVVSFDPYDDVACPSFTNTNKNPLNFSMEVLVMDSITKKPIPNSLLEIYKGEFYTQRKTDEDGRYIQKTGIYYYSIYAEKEGYKGRNISGFVNPKHYRLVIALPPLKDKTEPPIKEIIPVAKKEVETAKPAIPAPPVVSKPVSTSTHKNFPPEEYKKNNIIFLIDKSSSMNKPDCMPLLQTTMKELAGMTRGEDRITIITYANDAKVVLPGTNGNEHEKINDVINQLQCGGRTEGGKAIHTAYKNAEQNFIKGGVNQIIIATDGGFNGISEDEAELMKLVGNKAEDGILLSVLAFGQNRYGKAHINRLANQGKGFYLYIQNEEDARQKLTEAIKSQSKQ